jgi:catechol 2,3-dioxygenase
MITAVARVDLRVDDLDQAIAFYRDVAGLEPDPSEPAALRSPGGPVLLRLRDDGVTGPAPRRASGLFHTAIRFPARADLAAALRRIAGSRAAFTGASDHGVSEALYLDDPAGNGVELYWDRPREVWPDDMFTAPLDLQDLAQAGGEAPVAPESTDIGHVHLKVSDLPRAVGFWSGDLGFDVMHRYGDQAAFVATGGYHHHVGLNTWQSLGAGPNPPELAGLDRVVFSTDGETGERRDPDGITAELVAA